MVDRGAPLLKANFPRAWLDVNREPYELDPKMFAGRLPTYANVRSVRVAGGLGTIARIVSESEEIYAGPLRVEEGLARIDRVYKPYHAALGQLLTETRAGFGIAVLIDCHSMPSTVRGAAGRLRPDIVIGDRYGTSCARELAELSSEDPDPLRLLGLPQQALCRRLHHRALRQARPRLPRAPDRGQPRALSRRAAPRAERRLRPRPRGSRRLCRCSVGGVRQRLPRPSATPPSRACE